MNGAALRAFNLHGGDSNQFGSRKPLQIGAWRTYSYIHIYIYTYLYVYISHIQIHVFIHTHTTTRVPKNLDFYPTKYMSKCWLPFRSKLVDKSLPAYMTRAALGMISSCVATRVRTYVRLGGVSVDRSLSA